jgi:hypothetical protein
MISAGVFIARSNRDLAGIGAGADPVAEIAERDEPTFREAAKGAGESCAIGRRLRSWASQILNGHGRRIVHASIDGAPLACQHAAEDIGLQVAQARICFRDVGLNGDGHDEPPCASWGWRGLPHFFWHSLLRLIHSFYSIRHSARIEALSAVAIRDTLT